MLGHVLRKNTRILAIHRTGGEAHDDTNGLALVKRGGLSMSGTPGEGLMKKTRPPGQQNCQELDSVERNPKLHDEPPNLKNTDGY